MALPVGPLESKLESRIPEPQAGKEFSPGLSGLKFSVFHIMTLYHLDYYLLNIFL